MSLDSLPTEILRQIADEVIEDLPTLSNLTRTCKTISTICQPLLYRNIVLEEPRDVLLPIAYTLFTCPHVAREVRMIRLPALAAAPALPRRAQSRQNAKRQKPTGRHPWPDDPKLESVLHHQVAAALDGESDDVTEGCFADVLTGSREDLVAMLMLMNTPGLEELDLGAMGPRDDNSDTRCMFRHAAPRLTKLTRVIFGKTPKDLYDVMKDDEEVPRPDLEYSHSLFADLFLLPNVWEMIIYAIGPRFYGDYEDEEREDAFDFVLEIETNTSLQVLRVAEMLMFFNAHLDHILAHCPRLSWFQFLTNTQSETGDGPYDWGARWNRDDFEAALKVRADTLNTLFLTDTLFHDEAKTDDDRAHVSLRHLHNLKVVYLDGQWLTDGDQYNAYADNKSNQAEIEQRLVTMLPESIETIYLSCYADGGTFDEMMNDTIRTLIEYHQDERGFANFKNLGLEHFDDERIAVFRKMATPLGIRVRDLDKGWPDWNSPDEDPFNLPKRLSVS